MPALDSALDNLTLTVNEEFIVHSSITATFEALLEHMGPSNETRDGEPMPMVIEPRPGGRWFRDLGGDNGHFWGVVQAIKRPTLLEITGPLFMSYPVVSNVQYRLEPIEGGTRITFRHNAFGLISDEHRQGLAHGWEHLHEAVRKRAEAA